MTEPIPLQVIEAARRRLRGHIVRTPLVCLHVEDAPAEIYLKLENLQPIGSFKLRGAGNAIALAGPEQLARGVVTASAGNMAQGVAWHARRLGLKCTVIVPDHAPQTKLNAITRLGATIAKLPFDDWWQILVTGQTPDHPGFFVHPVRDPPVIAGNGTIGLEILEDLPDVDTVVIPFGGGGLSTGIASAVRALKPEVKMLAAEVETAAPFAPSLAAGHPVEVAYTPSFVDGIGGKCMIPGMWSLAGKLLDGSCVVSLAEIANVIRLLVERNRVVAEGAGAAATAAALSGKAGAGKIACVVSGGNIDPTKLASILRGEIP